ncbi:hypothetical protein B0H12DRAFT_1081246 [Mycena haematopus]|nr:hypothetical protein B0H12DRAFT_1081246 [Mycena haematopus]
MSSGNAILDLPASKLPLLHEGETSQGQLRQLEIHCANYFTLKSIAADKQVANVIGCFRDYRITSWLDNDDERTAANALEFKAFMALVRERLLPSDWERTLKQERNGRKQDKTESFLSFLTSVERLNSFLINTSYHLDESGLRTLLESNMTTDLADEGKATDATKYKDWAEIVKRRDNIRIRRIKELHAIADERAKRDRSKTNTNDERPHKRKRDENAPPSGTTGSSSAPASSSGNGKRCPKLTDDERALLTANHGCSRCR